MGTYWLYLLLRIIGNSGEVTSCGVLHTGDLLVQIGDYDDEYEHRNN